MLGFIFHFPEVRDWHSGTALTLIINLLTAVQVGTLIAQTRKVYVLRSSLGLSVITLTFYGFYFAAFFVYGIHKESLNMIVSGAQFVLYVPLLIGLWKYSGMTEQKQMKIYGPFLATIPFIMILVPWKEAFMLGLFAGILVSIWLMYRELKNIMGIGSVVIGFQYAFLLNTIFWFVYGVAITDWPLIIFNPLAAILLTMTIVLYAKKKRLCCPR